MDIEKTIEKINRQITIGECEKNIGIPVYISDLKTVLNELEKKDKVINEYEKECRMFKAFCRRVRRDNKHNVDEFNQGQEHKCNQFLNLLAGEENWDFEGKYFDETEKEIDKAENVGE